MAIQTLNRDPMAGASQPATTQARAIPSEVGGVEPAPSPPPAAPRTAAGQRALKRRRARISADRRPPSGMIPSGNYTAAVVSADHGHEVDDRDFLLGRWARLLCTVSLLTAVVVVGVVLLSSTSPEVIGVVTVAPGDTLWSIAQHAEPDADVRAVVDRIRDLNGLSGDFIPAGITLRVPTSGR
jgi:LysM repeat protein